MTATSRPARAPARWTLPGGGPQAAQAFRLLDTATARLVQSSGSAEYLLSVSCQGGVLHSEGCFRARPPLGNLVCTRAAGGGGWR